MAAACMATSLGLPVLLVVEASRQAASLAALVRGFRDHDPNLTIAGVVLNGVSTPRHQQLLSDVLEQIGMPLLGVLPRHRLRLPAGIWACCHRRTCPIGLSAASNGRRWRRNGWISNASGRT